MRAVESAFASKLKLLGFRRRGRTWWRMSEFAIQVINVQRGFGEQAHVNLGVYVRSFGEASAPKENHCHVRARLERVSDREYFESIRRLDVCSAPLPQALDALMTCGVPWLDSLSTRAGLCAFLEKRDSSHVFVHKFARDLCNRGA